MNLQPIKQTKYPHMRVCNEPLKKPQALAPIHHDQRNRELSQAVRNSLPPIVVVDDFHKLNPNESVIVVTFNESL